MTITQQPFAQTDQWSKFSNAIYKQKYAMPGEEWLDTATRVVTNVLDPMYPELSEEMIAAIAARKFMPGGRYLYAAGKSFHQTQNCLLMRAEDSREGWADLMYKCTSGLMTGAGNQPRRQAFGCVYQRCPC